MRRWPTLSSRRHAHHQRGDLKAGVTQKLFGFRLIRGFKGIQDQLKRVVQIPSDTVYVAFWLSNVVAWPSE